jgi:long-chain acyl-CoA synthetase
MILSRFRETASRYPENIAVQMKVGTAYRKYVYRELVAGIASVVRSLSEQGIRQGDRVAILSENRPEWIIAYLAVVSCGSVIVPLDAQLTEKEVSLLLTSSGAKAVCVSEACRPRLPHSTSLMVISFDPGAGILFTEMLTAYPDAELPPPPADGDLAALLYTSGTTGDPKGVMLSHGNLASNRDGVLKLKLIDHTDNLLCILPLHHTYPAMACILYALSVGATVTILNSLKGPDILSCMQETGVSVVVGVPQLFTGLRRAIFDEIQRKPVTVRLILKFLLGLNGLLRKMVGLNLGKFLFGKVHAMFGPRFRLFASGGARLEPEVFTDMVNLGFTIIEGYGLTETSPVCTFNPLKKQKPGSIGIPIPDVEVRIVKPDEHGHGEIAIRGPNVMLGYYEKPQETAEVIQEGWFYTGDIGYRDREGYFFITGRSKEMIVLATGKKIFPEELEQFYKQIPSIKEICLIQGERGLEAAVVPNFDYLRKMNISNSREYISFKLEDLAKDLPPYKRITGLKIFKDPLPVTRLGKIRRSMVKELYQEGGERAEKPVADIDSDLFSSPVAKRLLACLEPFSAKKKIVPDDNLELDLGLDSLARVELVVSIEKSFGISLPESFGSEVFTVKDVLLKLQELIALSQMKAGAQVRLSWAEILAQQPADEIKQKLTMDTGQLCNIGRYAIKLLLNVMLKLYCRISVRGLEKLPAKGPYVIASNHLSLADGPTIMAVMPWRIGSQTFFLGATEFFGGPATSRIAKLIQVIPVDMDTRLYGAMQLSAYVLRQGRILCVFPEGTRSRDGNIKEFKKGVGIIAKELKIPLVPVAITGTYEMLPSGKFFPKPVKVSVSIGNPLYPGDENYDEIVKSLYEEVVKLLKAGQSAEH